MAKEIWQTLSLHPLNGPLDTRSKPADVPVGGFRWKLNTRVSDENQLGRREGFGAAFADVDAFANHDHHHQGADREMITFGQEVTDRDGHRWYYDGTQSRISLLDETAGTWTDLATGMGAYGTRWRCAYLVDKILFTNNHDLPQIATIGSPDPSTSIAELSARGVTKALVAVEFNGIVILMNVEQEGKRYGARCVWCDLNDLTSWSLSKADTKAGVQDLPFSDEAILAALPLGAAVYIYTRKSIWRMNVAASADSTFSFTRVYTEPKNQSGCLAFPFTLVSDGENHWYGSRDGVYMFNPYATKPERKEWMHRATGVMYSNVATRMSQKNCYGPVAEYRPLTHELFFSWASGTRTINDWSIACNLLKETADVMDAGFTVIMNYRREPTSERECNEVQSFMAVSGVDWCWKDLGAGVFYREYARLAGSPESLTADIAETATFYTVGYRTVVRGLINTGLYDREKIIRNFLLDDVVADQDEPCHYRLRIGNAFNLRDANDTTSYCSVQWADEGTHPVACVDEMTISAMTAKNLRPAVATEWRVYRQGRFLFYELSVENSDGGTAIGGDLWINRFDFDVTVLPKPG